MVFCRREPLFFMKVDIPVLHTAYAYDRAGNRTSVQAGDRRESYHYDRGRLTTRTVEHTQDPAGKTYTYRYDAQGNTLGDGENTYLYDCLNRIAEVQTKAGDIQKNHYDAEGLRSQMEENGKLVSFVYADREVITEEDKAGAHIRYIRGHELLASDSERARTYYHYACDEMMDAVTGQYYLRARFYNPVIARFLSEDTYYGDGLNLYAYCHNNPVGYVDPSGHIKKICSKKYAELKQKEAEGGKLSLKEKYQIYEYEHRKTQPDGAGNDSKSGSNTNTSLSLQQALEELDASGLRPGQTELHMSQLNSALDGIQNNYNPTKAYSSVYSDGTNRYLVEGHHTTVAFKMLGKDNAINMNTATSDLPSATNVYWTKKRYQFWRKTIKIVED